MGLTGDSSPTGGLSKVDSESEMDKSHIGFKVIGPIAAGQKGFRQDKQGYVELRPGTLAEGTHGSVYITPNYSVGVGQATVASFVLNQVTLNGIANPWQRYNNRALSLEAGSPAPRLGGTYNIHMVVTVAGSNVAQGGEQEHLDDFEEAWNRSHGEVLTAVAGVRAQLGQLPLYPASPQNVDAQVVAAKKRFYAALVTYLTQINANLAPVMDMTNLKTKDIAVSLEQHWRMVYGRLCGLSKIRDYNRSHSAVVEVRVTSVGQSPVRQAAAGVGGGGGGNMNPLYRPAVQAARVGPDPFAGGGGFVNPLHAQARGAPMRITPEVPGSLNILLGGRVADLLGGTARLITFANPYFSLAKDVDRNDPGVDMHRW
jgi:hypothetical protein